MFYAISGRMLTGLDHIVLICNDLDVATSNYKMLLGREPDWTAVTPDDGTASVWFQIGETGLELLGPEGDGPVGDKLKKMIAAGGGGLVSLAFSCAQIDEMHTRFSKRGLVPSDISHGQSTDSATGKTRSWKRLRLDTSQTGGVRQFVIQNEKSTPIKSKHYGDDSVQSLDHVVINSLHPERAAALYGARLGCDLRLDTERVDLASRFLFFRVGTSTIEIVSRLGVSASTQMNDSLWGLSWYVKNLDMAHKRVKKAGFNVTDIRPGRKKGTQVFTVLDRTCNTPTLFIERS